MVAGINDEDAIMIVIDRNAGGLVEVAWLAAILPLKAPGKIALGWLVAFLAELGHERESIIIITREYLHSMIPAIDDEQETSMMVEHQASREMELAISLAFLLGAERELDSSISIKRIVSHLFLFNLSHTTTKRCSKLQTAQTKEKKI